MSTVEHDAWGSEDVSSGKGAGDENFPVGSLLISRDQRPHVHAYYDFARVIDDIVAVSYTHLTLPTILLV